MSWMNSQDLNEDDGKDKSDSLTDGGLFLSQALFCCFLFSSFPLFPPSPLPAPARGLPIGPRLSIWPSSKLLTASPNDIPLR